jgi:small subunit ribosomal protein S6
MNKYEITIVLKSNLEESVHKDEIEKVHALIARFGGTIDKVDDWGKRRLAYNIKKSSEGFFSFITVSSEPTAPAEIESRLRIMESVLRFLIIRVDAK